MDCAEPDDSYPPLVPVIKSTAHRQFYFWVGGIVYKTMPVILRRYSVSSTACILNKDNGKRSDYDIYI